MKKCHSHDRCWFVCAAAAALFVAGCGGGDGGSGGTGGSTGGTGGVTGGTGGTGGVTGGTGGVTGGTGGVPTCADAMLGGFDVETGLFDGVSPDAASFAGVVTGTVTDAGSGALPVDCSEAVAGKQGAWVVFEDADAKSWTACYTGEGASMPIEIGEEITAERKWLEGYFSAASSLLTIKRGGALVVLALTQARDPFDWHEDAITLADGDLLCSTDGGGGCGVEGYELRVLVEEAETSLAPGETGTVPGFEVHAGYWEHYVDGGGCDAGQYTRDAFVIAKP